MVDGLRALADGGFVVAIATNQPGAAKGQVSREAIERTNAALVAMLADHGVTIAEVAVCFHHPEGAERGGDFATLVEKRVLLPEAGSRAFCSASRRRSVSIPARAG